MSVIQICVQYINEGCLSTGLCASDQENDERESRTVWSGETGPSGIWTEYWRTSKTAGSGRGRDWEGQSKFSVVQDSFTLQYTLESLTFKANKQMPLALGWCVFLWFSDCTWQCLWLLIHLSNRWMFVVIRGANPSVLGGRSSALRNFSHSSVRSQNLPLTKTQNLPLVLSVSKLSRDRLFHWEQYRERKKEGLSQAML